MNSIHKRCLVLCFAAIFLMDCSQAFTGGTESISGDPSSYDVPLGIALESLPYPYPVSFFPVIVEGQPLRMAYMDVAPVSQPNGRTVLLFHGKNFYGAYWSNVIARLASEGYRVVVPDQIGFGKSSKPDIHYSFDFLCETNRGLLDRLKIPEAIVLGHSMGGMVAIRFARLYPERTSRLILENPIGLEDYRLKIPPVPLEKMFENEMKQNTQSIRTFLKRYVVKWDPSIYEPFVESRARIMLSGEFPRWARSSALTYRMIYEQPVVYELPWIKAPTLLVIGQKDTTVVGRGFASKEALETLGRYPELGKQAAKAIPQAKLVELEDAGHIPHLENPTKFMDAVLEFLRN